MEKTYSWPISAIKITMRAYYLFLEWNKGEQRYKSNLKKPTASGRSFIDSRVTKVLSTAGVLTVGIASPPLPEL